MCDDPIKYVCGFCGSENVVKDAWASWSTELQEWVLDHVFDDAFCESCDGETKLVRKPV